jgi:hypothetical protein
MSRAMNIKLPQAEVTAQCAAAKVAISAIETLPSGGTHLVCVTIEGADDMRQKLKKNLIEGRVKRFAFQTANKY